MNFGDWDFFAVLHRICQTIWNIFLIWYFGNKRHSLPPIQNEQLLLEPAVQLAEKIRTKKVKSEDVVKAYIKRIETVNPIINAVVQERFQEALVEAKEADAYVANSGKSPEELAAEKPFLGVPITTKNAIGVKDMMMDAGVRLKKGFKTTKDSVVIENLRNAGAIPLCITNVPEFCMWSDASCTLYGITKNPYDLTKHPGGSSGGESALLGAAASVVGIGNDIFGSVRNPAYLSGVFAHKPTKKIVSNEGQFPSSFQTDLDEYNVTGPMCRYAVDLLPTYKIMAGANASKLKLDQEVNLRNLNVYYTENYSNGPYVSPMDSEVTKPIYKIKNYLEETYGTQVQKITLPVPVHRFMHIWMTKYTEAKVDSMESFVSDDKPLNYPKELLKWCFRLSKHTIHALYFMAVRRFSSAVKPEGAARNLKDLEKIKTFLETLLGDNGVLLFPTAPRTSYYQQEQLFRFFNNGYTAIFSVLGYPVTQCAMGLTQDGMPQGVQVVATGSNDHLTLAMAVELEKQFGGWKAP